MLSATKKARESIDRMEKFSASISEYLKQRREPFKFAAPPADAEPTQKPSTGQVAASSSRRKSMNKLSASRYQNRDPSTERNKDFSSSKRKSANLDQLAEDENSIIQQTLPQQPKSIKNCVMKEHQIKGLNWLIDLHECDANGVLADQMGLGKTLQSIAFLAYLSEIKNDHGPHLIVCPLSVTYNWQNELKRFYPQCRALIVRARAEFRDEDKRDYFKHRHNVLIASYDSIQYNLSFFKRINFSYLVLDEAHRIKNDEAMFGDLLRSLHCKNKLLLTGTPLSNNILELYSLLSFLMPHIFNSKTQFEESFGILSYKNDKQKEKVNVLGLSDQDTVKKIHNLIAPFVLRRLKQDTTLNLPEKKEILVYCPLTLMQKNLYKALLTRSIKIQSIKSGSLMMDLRKAAIHPYMFPTLDTEAEEIGPHLVNNSGKFIILDKLIEKFVIGAKEKVLIFSQLTSALNIVEDYLAYKKLSCFRLDGAVDIEDRVKHMDEFNSKQNDIRVYLLSTRAGGLGVNLIAARYVIILDSDWNPQVDMQAMDRTHRIGQTREVKVFRLISKNTIEEKIQELQTIKLKIDYLVIERGRQINKDKNAEFQINNLSEQEMKDLTYFGANSILTMGDEDCTNVDIDKLLEDGEKAAESMAKTLEQKVKEYADNATNFDHNTTIQVFEGEDYRKRKVEDQEAVRKALLESIRSIQKDAPVVKRQAYKYTYKCSIDDMPFQNFAGEKGRQVTELKKKKDKYLYFKDMEPDRITEKFEEFTPEDEVELLTLSEQIIEVTKKEFNEFVKGICTYGRHNLDDIRKEFLPDWTEGKLYDYAIRFWAMFDTIPNYASTLAKIDREEEVNYTNIFMNMVLEAAFGCYDSYDDIFIPYNLMRFILKQDRKAEENLVTFLLFQHSRMLKEKIDGKTLKSLLKIHPCLKTDLQMMAMSGKDLEVRLERTALKFLEFYGISIPPKLSGTKMPYDFKKEHKAKKGGVWLIDRNLEVRQEALKAIEKMRTLNGIFTWKSTEEDPEDKTKVCWLADFKKRQESDIEMTKAMAEYDQKISTAFKKYLPKEAKSKTALEEVREIEEDEPTMIRDAENLPNDKAAGKKKGRQKKGANDPKLFDFGIEVTHHQPSVSNTNNPMDVERAFEEELQPGEGSMSLKPRTRGSGESSNLVQADDEFDTSIQAVGVKNKGRGRPKRAS